VEATFANSKSKEPSSTTALLTHDDQEFKKEILEKGRFPMMANSDYLLFRGITNL
jgi:hypothetical protein